MLTAGYNNLIAQAHGDAAYGYVYNGLFSYLDHALASASLVAHVTGVTQWHNNADEPRVLDYDMSYTNDRADALLYAPDAYRASDHDPVVVGLQLGAFDLAVSMTDSPDPVQVGAEFAYTIKVTNLGSLLAPGVWLTDTLPAALTLVSMTSDSGTCDSATRTCDLGELAAGASATLTLFIQAPSLPGDFTNTATVRADLPDNPANNTTSETTRVRYLLFTPVILKN